ncbi:alpha,alpha-trehalase TreF [Nafulsella turpanensis]|uniref:alpha,alpha-trehalase TreF n=1 Tax=Nafulsella turpanensis TaxID=1265690 RepID=UPI000349F991|nr:alpha,alpha-trehalase TreF [Nafulsella turpanensis]
MPYSQLIKERTNRYKPYEQLQELFEAVQLGHIFSDSKTFVDCVPKQSPEEVLLKYHQQKKEEGFDLREFILQNFELPEKAGSHFTTNPHLSMDEHILNHWDYLSRPADEKEKNSTLIPLPYKYIVPGGRFREIYYWDSYFTMHGLAASGRLDMMENLLQNFACLIDTIGFIPNGNRNYYLSRSQPPFFSSMVTLFQCYYGTEKALTYLPQLLKEYDFWMHGLSELNEETNATKHVVRMPDGSILNRYFDPKKEPRPESYIEDVELAKRLAPEKRGKLFQDIRAAAESGWDFSSRWCRDEKSLATINTTDIVPVDLNSLLHHLESTIAEFYFAEGKDEEALLFDERALERKAAIEKWLWSEEKQFYVDYDFVAEKINPTLTLAAVYPLYQGLASEEHARLVAQKLQSDFLKEGGLVTSLVESGQQWDYPNGWAPLQWMAFKGLEGYDMQELSQEISTRWLRINRKVFLETGKMMEKYNVVNITQSGGGGEYPLQDGFGWTNGVDIAIINAE